MDRIKVSQYVDIRRSDGRIHGARIHVVKPEQRSVTVEWTENGVSHGKDISFDELLRVNPQLGFAASDETGEQTADHPMPVRNHDEDIAGCWKWPKKFGSSTIPKSLTISASPLGHRRAMLPRPKHVSVECVGDIRYFREYRSQIDFHPIQKSDLSEEHQICVCVRKRPLNAEEQLKDIDVVTVLNHKQVVVHQPQTKVDLTKHLVNSEFVFDYAFDEAASNELVYRFTAQPLVKTIFEKGIATCFAYGQTGSGKTHTMGGNFTGRSQNVADGIYAMTAKDVFQTLHERRGTTAVDLTVSCSYFEIYGSKLFDLLNKKVQLKIMEDGRNHLQIIGLTEVPVSNEQEVIKLLQRGNRIRAAGQTSTNVQSSRSHAIFQFILRTKYLHGKFSLIDLAGNEKGADTLSMNKQMHMESAEINRSLLVLKECIRNFGTENYLPFRASKLTLALRDSFIGNNAKTCMIAMISPGMSCCEQTLNTLRYAERYQVRELVVPSLNEHCLTCFDPP
ncbi:unnamed protein product [Soboliphyme baturini]|uniref:Kinesin-like protein n=1 Tax=Soboliphyme baturini TaxID=241478 RepID=A0A183IQI9_9BILA|nr:unnamed protein product [Soboliphyme baturini]